MIQTYSYSYEESQETSEKIQVSHFPSFRHHCLISLVCPRMTETASSQRGFVTSEHDLDTFSLLLKQQYNLL